MSTQRGNVSRSRPPKYQNKVKFKNDLHDTSHTIKNINKLEITNICNHCKDVIEWKIKYKKYKPLKNPSTCVNCHNKNVKHAYHNLCNTCAVELRVCPKCGKEEELVKEISNVKPEEILKNTKVKSMLQELPERKRRMFYRLLNKSEENLCSEEKIIEKLGELQLKCNQTFVDDIQGTDSSENCDD